MKHSLSSPMRRETGANPPLVAPDAVAVTLDTLYLEAARQARLADHQRHFRVLASIHSRDAHGKIIYSIESGRGGMLSRFKRRIASLFNNRAKA